MSLKQSLFGALLLTALPAFVGAASPGKSPEYVALGSSFAAGYGLGPRAPDSPVVCLRSANGYPHEIARQTALSLVDMSCSGSTTEHILHGGQYFMGPQLNAVGPATKLVTITSGGNDVNYIGDLTMASGGLGGVGKVLWPGPAPLATRDFQEVENNLRDIVETIRRQAPAAKVVIVSYPPVLPPKGTCEALGVEDSLVDLSRQVATKLLEATRAAARATGVIFVDMAAIGVGHDACSAEPWVNGKSHEHGAPFHPNVAGTRAIAQAVVKALH